MRVLKKDRRGIEEGSKKGGGWELKIENWELIFFSHNPLLGHTPRLVADPFETYPGLTANIHWMFAPHLKRGQGWLARWMGIVGGMGIENMPTVF